MTQIHELEIHYEDFESNNTEETQRQVAELISKKANKLGLSNLRIDKIDIEEYDDKILIRFFCEREWKK